MTNPGCKQNAAVRTQTEDDNKNMTQRRRKYMTMAFIPDFIRQIKIKKSLNHNLFNGPCGICLGCLIYDSIIFENGRGLV